MKDLAINARWCAYPLYELSKGKCHSKGEETLNEIIVKTWKFMYKLTGYNFNQMNDQQKEVSSNKKRSFKISQFKYIIKRLSMKSLQHLRPIPLIMIDYRRRRKLNKKRFLIDWLSSLKTSLNHTNGLNLAKYKMQLNSLNLYANE